MEPDSTTWYGGATEGGPTSEMRGLTDEEKRRRMQKHFPELSGQRAQAPGPPVPGGVTGVFGARPINNAADQFGVEFTDAQKAAPEDIREAILFLKVSAASYREAPPEEVAVKMREAAQLVEQWERNH